MYLFNSSLINIYLYVLKEIVETFKKTNCDGTYANLVFMDANTMSKVQRVWKNNSLMIS